MNDLAKQDKCCLLDANLRDIHGYFGYCEHKVFKRDWENSNFINKQKSVGQVSVTRCALTASSAILANATSITIARSSACDASIASTASC